MAAPTGETYPWRLQGAIYAAAFFTGNLFPMVSVVMPLWALHLGASPLVIGLIISSRQILTVTFSIHGGALLDRFGPRQVILVLGLAGAGMMGLFPVFPFVWAAILLQAMSGFTETTNWIGAQAMVGNLLRGHPVFAGRMTAAARIGGFIGPPMTGFCWEHFGPFGAFGFLALWVAGGAVAALFVPAMPKKDAAVLPDGQAPPQRKTRAADTMPKFADYATAFRMLLLPAVALVILATFMRQAGSGIQSSFYPIWLTQHGISPTTIGWLIGIGNIVSAGAALSIGPLTRRIREHWLLILMVLLAVVPIAITPMLGLFALLVIAMALRGAGQGLVLPLMMSLASRAVTPDLQGRVAALRITFNRAGGALVPLVMGALAEVVGLEQSFYIVGIAGCVLIAGLAVWVGRSPAFRNDAPGD